MEVNTKLGYKNHISFNSKDGSIQKTSSSYSNLTSIKMIFCNTFLPVNYPHSVKPEYLSYQIWDSLQALCSYIRNVLTAKAVLVAVGVGNPGK